MVLFYHLHATRAYTLHLLAMVRCTHKGCGQEYDPENNTPESCTYHPGAPVFHEGLKSWSCCKDVNKPVLEFDQFMQIEVGSAASSLCKTERLSPCRTGMYAGPAYR